MELAQLSAAVLKHAGRNRGPALGTLQCSAHVRHSGFWGGTDRKDQHGQGRLASLAIVRKSSKWFENEHSDMFGHVGK